MRITSWLVVAMLLVGCQTIQSPATAKAEITAATQAWADALNKCDTKLIAALYDSEAVLWGTGANNFSVGVGIREYFNRVCQSSIVTTVAFTEQLIRVYGDTAVNSGIYAFTIVKAGPPFERQIGAIAHSGYSMTFRKRDGQWLIVDHHSSSRPPPPRR